MSYFIDAFVESTLSKQHLIQRIEQIVDKKTLGWIEDDTSSLVSLLAQYFSTNLQESIFFSITDGKSKSGADYLIDISDYGPESDMELPLRGRDRLSLIVSLCKEIFEIEEVLKIGIAPNDSGYIEDVKFVSLEGFRDMLFHDFEEERAPPDTLYILDKLSVF